MKNSNKKKRVKKYSQKYNKIFNFYLDVYRSGLITFCGIEVNVKFDLNGADGKLGFRDYDNGKSRTLISKHPNILKGVITGKKGWGLWVKQWSEGIAEWSFTQEEIIEDFTKHGIEIPEPFLIEWNKLIEKKKAIRNQKYFESLTK